MPNTTPPNDSRAVTELVVRRALEVGAVHVYPVGAISKGLAGETLAEMGELKDAGCVAVSDDGRPVMNAELMRPRDGVRPHLRADDRAALRGPVAVARRRDERGAGVDARPGSARSRRRRSRRWSRATSSCAR
jgi:dihydroorotase-like cyclic amidohydrolase